MMSGRKKKQAALKEASLRKEDSTEEFGPESELIRAMAKLLEKADYSDFTIKCRSLEFPVHKIMICTRSSFFAAACKSGFQETSSHEIDLGDDDPEIVTKMIDYFYKLDYDDGFKPAAVNPQMNAGGFFGVRVSTVVEDSKKENALSVVSPPMINAQVYAIAEKYDIKGLKVLSRSKFRDSITDNWNNEEFSRIVRTIYESTPEGDQGLRSEVAAIAMAHITTLQDRGEFRIIEKQVHDFTLDLLDLIVKKYVQTTSLGWD